MPQTQDTQLAKSERLQIRATPRQASLIKAGAAKRNLNLTEYMVSATCAQAEMDLADENQFVLSPKKWNAFITALDARPAIPPGLKRLFARNSVAESR